MSPIKVLNIDSSRSLKGSNNKDGPKTQRKIIDESQSVFSNFTNVETLPSVAIGLKLLEGDEIQNEKKDWISGIMLAQSINENIPRFLVKRIISVYGEKLLTILQGISKKIEILAILPQLMNRLSSGDSQLESKIGGENAENVLKLLYSQMVWINARRDSSIIPYKFRGKNLEEIKILLCNNDSNLDSNNFGYDLHSMYREVFKSLLKDEMLKESFRCELRPEVSHSIKIFYTQIQILIALIKFRLLLLPEEEIKKIHFLKKSWIREQRLLLLVKRLEMNLNETERDRKEKLAEFNLTVNSLLTQIDSLYLHTHQDIVTLIGEAQKIDLLTTKGFDHEIQSLNTTLQKAIHAGKLLRTRLEELEKRYREKRKILEDEVEAAIALYDREMLMRQDIFDRFKKEEKVNGEEIAKLEIKLLMADKLQSEMLDEKRAKVIASELLINKDKRKKKRSSSIKGSKSKKSKKKKGSKTLAKSKSGKIKSKSKKGRKSKSIKKKVVGVRGKGKKKSSNKNSKKLNKKKRTKKSSKSKKRSGSKKGKSRSKSSESGYEEENEDSDYELLEGEDVEFTGIEIIPTLTIKKRKKVKTGESKRKTRSKLKAKPKKVKAFKSKARPKVKVKKAKARVKKGKSKKSSRPKRSIMKKKAKKSKFKMSPKPKSKSKSKAKSPKSENGLKVVSPVKKSKGKQEISGQSKSVLTLYDDKRSSVKREESQISQFASSVIDKESKRSVNVKVESPSPEKKEKTQKEKDSEVLKSAQAESKKMIKDKTKTRAKSKSRSRSKIKSKKKSKDKKTEKSVKSLLSEEKDKSKKKNKRRKRIEDFDDKERTQENNAEKQTQNYENYEDIKSFDLKQGGEGERGKSEKIKEKNSVIMIGSKPTAGRLSIDEDVNLKELKERERKEKREKRRARIKLDEKLAQKIESERIIEYEEEEEEAEAEYNKKEYIVEENLNNDD